MKKIVIAGVLALFMAACTPKLILTPGEGEIVAPGTMTVTGEIPEDLVIGGKAG